MDEEIDRLVIGVRADTAGFARDVAGMKDVLATSVGAGADKAARAIDTALARAVRTGKLGFDDLGAAALKVLEQIAVAAIRSGLGLGLGGGGFKIGVPDWPKPKDPVVLTDIATALVGSVLGLPGRATGGPVSPGAAYLVGERGPELFVPTASGRIAAPAAVAPGRDVRVSIAINAPTGSEPQALTRSGRQVARAVARAIEQAQG